MDVTTIDGKDLKAPHGSTDLSMLKANERARIIDMVGGKNLKQKLSIYGFGIGDMIRVVSNCGPVTVSINRNTISVGRGIAKKIFVKRERYEKEND